ncbi:UxaA family hydrolase [Zhouia sp. PK063]|uniref:UxaA family hydrolase n=1 Tax=Zhouia sp. PK063 TaxID=3373602 RepID=UPI00378C6123
MEKTLIIAPTDNVAVALSKLDKGDIIELSSGNIILKESIPVKHKLALKNFRKHDIIRMYGVPVGEAMVDIPSGYKITTENIKHLAAAYSISDFNYKYQIPDIEYFKKKTFSGFYRNDGQVGTANYWIVVPLVFCQNRNLKVLREVFETELGFKKENNYKLQLRSLIKGEHFENIVEHKNRVFENIDGIKFLEHHGGCGGTREDAQTLINLLAGYIKNPNVAGATVLSLGCQHAQMSLLKEALEKNEVNRHKPVYYFEQQAFETEHQMLSEIIDTTYKALCEANQHQRQPATLDKLTIGLECGGSDGFSGISANPLIGLVSDKITGVGGSTILSEFPELCGVEQDLIDRSVDRSVAERFVSLMEAYNKKAKQVGSGFEMNPSPGNIKDGLITDAIKSAGAATKGGRSPIYDVLDYAEYIKYKGLNLLCTPGNDVESTTGLAGSGANLILFSTGLGTPTGNPICPVIKISSNSMLPERMKDIIDFDAGRLFSQGLSLETLSEELIDVIIAVASGEMKTKAALLEQDDFIPWKRGVSL